MDREVRGAEMEGSGRAFENRKAGRDATFEPEVDK
jgi:hypothetical protein